MNVLMLTAMRSGSTYLFNMLKATGSFSFPAPHAEHPSLKAQAEIGEFLAPNGYLDPWDVHGIPKTKELCEQHLKKKANLPFRPPCLLKILKEHFEYYLLDYDDRPLVETLFPKPKYIWLEREDVFARTVSAYQFFVSKMPHLWNERMQAEYKAKEIPWDTKGILDVYYNHVKNCDWGPFLEGANHHHVEYEDLIARPQEVLQGCLDYLGMKGDVESIVAKQPKIKTERPETKEYVQRLKRTLTGML